MNYAETYTLRSGSFEDPCSHVVPFEQFPAPVLCPRVRPPEKRYESVGEKKEKFREVAMFQKVTLRPVSPFIRKDPAERMKERVRLLIALSPLVAASGAAALLAASVFLIRGV